MLNYEKNLLSELSKAYPDGIVIDFFSTGELYRKVRFQSVKNSKSIDEYLSDNGFTYIRKCNVPVGIEVLDKLHNVFSYTYTEIGNLFNVSRQRLFQIKKIGDRRNTVDKEIDDITHEALKHMFNKGLREYQSEDVEVYLFNREFHFAILAKRENRVIFLVDDEIPKTVLKHFYKVI